MLDDPNTKLLKSINNNLESINNNLGWAVLWLFFIFVVLCFK